MSAFMYVSDASTDMVHMAVGIVSMDKNIIMVVLELLFCIVFVVAITYAAILFNSKAILFWYLAPVLCYMGSGAEINNIKGENKK